MYIGDIPLVPRGRLGTHICLTELGRIVRGIATYLQGGSDASAQDLTHSVARRSPVNCRVPSGTDHCID